MKTLLDLGACVGDFTVSWLGENPNGNVICLEPEPDNLKVLEERFGGDPRVKIDASAVSLGADSVVFFKGTSSTNGSMSDMSEHLLRAKLNEGNKDLPYINVSAKKVSQILQEYQIDAATCDLKIDVEGFEHRILCQMLEEGIVPNYIFMEDGCRKIYDAEEHIARLEFYKKIKNRKIGSRVSFETNVDVNNKRAVDELILKRNCESNPDTRIVGYTHIEHWQSSRKIDNPRRALKEFEREALESINTMAEKYQHTSGHDIINVMASSKEMSYICWNFVGPFKVGIWMSDPDNAWPKEAIEELTAMDFNTGRSDTVLEFARGLMVSFRKDPYTDICVPVVVPVLSDDIASRTGGIYKSSIWLEAAKVYWERPILHPQLHRLFGVDPGHALFPPLETFEV